MHARILALTALLAAPLVATPTSVHAAATCHGLAVTIEGQPDTTITGTPGDDVILAPYASSGSVNAGAGDDVVCVVVDASADTLYAPTYPVRAGGGEDTIVLVVDSDIDVKLDSSATWDVGDVHLQVGLGSLEDAVVSGHRVNVYGTKADNHLVARSTDGALLTGKDGDDVLWLGVVAGVPNHDGLRLASGGPGNDVLTGSPVDDVLTGGPGHDRAVGRAGKDVCTAEVRRSCEVR
jgi:Ca2+-binding RTX toxin-like protein